MSFILILKDSSEFGTVNLTGIHSKVTSEYNAYIILDRVDEQQFDRVFLYVDGLNDGSFYLDHIKHTLAILIANGAELIPTHSLTQDISSKINDQLTKAQYSKKGYCKTFTEEFTKIKTLTKSEKITALADLGLKYCDLFYSEYQQPEVELAPVVETLPSNVISLFAHSKTSKADSTPGDYFEQLKAKNKANADRVARERLSANENVKRKLK